LIIEFSSPLKDLASIL